MEVARALLRLEFDKSDQQRMRELAAKAREAREATLTPDEENSIDNYERVGSPLAVLKSKARKTLNRSSRRRG